MKDTRREKDVERAGDLLMASLGFDTYRLSQARATNQTPGISDRLYLHETMGLAVWWEAKREGGKPSPAQLRFRALCQVAKWHHVLGTDDALIDWCETMGLVRRLANGLQVVRQGLPYPHVPHNFTG